MGGTLTADHFAARYLDFREITYYNGSLSLSLSLSLSHDNTHFRAHPAVSNRYTHTNVRTYSRVFCSAHIWAASACALRKLRTAQITYLMGKMPYGRPTPLTLGVKLFFPHSKIQ